MRTMMAWMVAALVLVLGGSGSAWAEGGEKALKKAMAAGDKGAMLAALETLSQENDQKAAKAILGVALMADDVNTKFTAADTNEIYQAAKVALAGITEPKALQFIYKSLDTQKQTSIRIILLQVCDVKDDPEAEKAIVDSLSDKDPLVAGVAARILGAKPKFHDTAKALTALMDTLGKVEKDRRAPWQDCIEALLRLSGQSGIELAADWRNWWKGAEETFKPGARPSESGATVLREAPQLFGQEILSKQVVFILDVSGSMAIKDPVPEGGKKKPVEPNDPEYPKVPDERMRMHRLKEAMIEAIKGLPEDTRFTIVTFSSGINRWKPALTPASAANKTEAIKFAQGMSPSGFTWSDTALEEAFKVEGANAFYFFSDGIPQRGKNPQGGPDYIDKNEILEKVRQLNRTRKVRIYSIGIGEADPAFMRKLADDNDGKYRHVE